MKELTPEIVLHEYDVEGLSFGAIAKKYGTYSNKVKRIYIRAGGQPRDKSAAQKLALKTGRSEHPTEGRERTPEERERISEAVAAEWANASEEQREARSEAARKQWEELGPARQQELLKMARDAARAAAQTGSKLELAIKAAVEEAGYFVHHQYDDLLENPRLRIDIFVPQLFCAIEVDGPSHFEAIWGEENYQKNMRADLEKTGILIAHGLAVIRVKNRNRHVSKKMERDLITKLLEVLEKIKGARPKRYRKLIEVEV